jgi:hypothetical protein
MSKSQKLPKLTKAHTIERVKVCAYKMLDGYTPSQIYYMFQEEWGVTPQMVYLYCRQARAQMGKEFVADESSIRKDVIIRYQWLYQLAMRDKRYDQAKQILDSLVKMTQITQLDITTGGKPINTIELVEVRNEIDITPHDEI